MNKQKENLLREIEEDVTLDDIEYCKKQLSKRDRIGKYSIWLCIIAFSLIGFYLSDAIFENNPINRPLYSYIPVLGKHLWDAPTVTKTPIIGGYIEAVGIAKFIIISISTIFGYFLGKVVSSLIRNGAIQDERNRHKIC